MVCVLQGSQWLKSIEHSLIAVAASNPVSNYRCESLHRFQSHRKVEIVSAVIVVRANGIRIVISAGVECRTPVGDCSWRGKASIETDEGGLQCRGVIVGEIEAEAVAGEQRHNKSSIAIMLFELRI